MNNYKKLQKVKGLICTTRRNIGHFFSLNKIKRQQGFLTNIEKNGIKLICSAREIHIFWNGLEVTRWPGLNIGIDSLGTWTDSTKADWQIIEKKDDSLKIRIVFRDLPIIQVWSLSIKEDSGISWDVDMEIEGRLHIDEIRLIGFVNSRFKTWISDYQQGNFPRFEDNFQDLYVSDKPTSLVGARFPFEGSFLPSFVLECQDNEKNLLAVIQRSPSNLKASIVGFKRMYGETEKVSAPGNYHLFSERIGLYEDGAVLDNMIERIRCNDLNSLIKYPKQKSKKNKSQKVLLANLPWKTPENNWGVRAGSRWPHIKDRSEGNYLPFPFFLTYATSLLKKNGFEAIVVDAIAERILEDNFIEYLSSMDFDLVVIETSVPSFHYDMQFLEKISSLEIPIALCGPQPEIYNTEFLKTKKFINFVLFGEYEFTLLELVKAISGKKRNLAHIRGLIWRDGKKKIVKNLPREPFDINLLPWPYRESLPMQEYWDLPGDIPHPSAQMIASRGCPFSCNFCLWPQLLFGGRTYRARDIMDVVDEMEHLLKVKRFKSIYFDDDTFNVGKERIIKLCDEIIKRGLNSTPWAIMAKPDLMDEQMLDKLKEAGLHAVKYGLESSSQKLLNRCGKRLDVGKAQKMIEYTKSLGIKIHLTFAFGLIGETEETLKSTIDFALQLDPQSAQFTIVTPFPGTALFDELDKKGRILTKDWSLYDGHNNCVFQPDSISPEFLEQGKQYAYRIWAEHQRKKRGFIGDVRRFFSYLRQAGALATYHKTISYLEFFALKRKKYLGKL
ncbi:B12-binding domain-containing radical SAM protein [Candidatus Omnitrophota bacterium]